MIIIKFFVAIFFEKSMNGLSINLLTYKVEYELND